MTKAVRRNRIPLLDRTATVRKEPRGRYRLGHHQRVAGLGVWCAVTANDLRDEIRTWKRAYPFDQALLAKFAAQTADLVLAWSGGVFPADVLVTVPPRGASLFGESASWPYAAGLLAEAVACRLGIRCAQTLKRTDGDAKRYHGPAYSLKQPPYVASLPDPPPGMVLVVDDLITSGATMRLSLEAIRGANVPAFGFAYSGHGRGN